MIMGIVFGSFIFSVSLPWTLSSSLPPMQCYIGNCTTSADCRKLELKADCPTDQAYDACETFIDRKANGRLSIVKKCGLSPCSFSDLNSWTDECDRKSDEDSYTCTSCCRNSLCNGQSDLAELKGSNYVFFIYAVQIIFSKING
eukprot:TRINITY_DN7118_c0_g1_i1.p1 TRINITY_DN7118_c0_g1~~TRINITY_DN7118_c0_g1_i1.p1  ORF type:complete len:144 (-),score=22.95 TRINITY_DN7118_c0_g1_i1:15-446(-)